MANTWITEGDCRSSLYGLHMMYVCSCNIDARWLTHGSQMEIAHLDHMARIWSCNIDARWLTHGSRKAIADLGYMACIWCTCGLAILVPDGRHMDHRRRLQIWAIWLAYGVIVALQY